MLRVWQGDDPEPLNGYDESKKENHFLLKVGDKEYPVAVIRNYQSSVVEVDGDNNPVHKGDAMDIMSVVSVGDFPLVDLMKTREGDTITETITGLARELDKKINP